MSVTFEFSGKWEYDGRLDAQDLAHLLRENYAGDVCDFLLSWSIDDLLTVTVDGEKVFGP